jgi:hypothetical protein
MNPENAIMTKLPIATLSLLAAGLLSAFPASAQSNDELLKELRALRERVNQLEQKLQAVPAAPAGAQWGMTPEQTQELSRVATKAEAIEDSRDALGFKGLKVSGYMDPTFIANKRQNRAGFQFLNGVGDTPGGYSYDNSTFGVVSLDFQKETDSGTKYRLTIVPYRGTESVGRFENRIVNEASVAVPLGDPTTLLIAGHIPDWSGYEYIPANQNKLITHNLLVDLTLPATYTGAGVQSTVGKWIIKGMLANVNSAIKNAGEKSPSLVYRADYAAAEYYGIGLAGLHGKVANANAGKDTRADLFEIDGYFTRGDWSMNAQFSVGRQQQASITPDPVSTDLRTAQWWGLSALAAYKLSPRWEVVGRADFINNRKNGGGLYTYAAADGVNGIGPDQNGGDPEVGANRTALSLGTSFALDPSTTIKAEYRLDRASQAVFEQVKTPGTFSKSNSLFATSVVVSF